MTTGTLPKLAPLKFGTDGWRAVIADDYTVANVERVAQAYCDVLKAEAGGDVAGRPLLVGFDTRFLSDRFAAAAASVATANGFKVHLADRPSSSPAISWSVKTRGAWGAMMITASHNPPRWNGFKIKAEYGGSAMPDLTAKVEAELDRQVAGTTSTAPAQTFDPRTDYFAQLRKMVDLDRIAASGLKIVCDPMFGAGQGYLPDLFAGTKLDLVQLHGHRDPYFGGVNPEPIALNLGELMATTAEAARQHPFTVGLAFDGDADRIGAVDERGNFISSHRILCLLLRHLVEVKGWTGGVIKTFSTTRLLEKMAKRYDLRVFETPIGFKYICELMLSEDILIGGEESGGIGIKNHMPERDGILCGLLLAEIAATHGKPLGVLIDELMAEYGPHEYDRVDLHLKDNAAKDEVLGGLEAEPPREVAGEPVTEVETRDGIKLNFGDGAWLLFRASGTEPLLRVYAEAPTLARVNALLSWGQARAGV